MNSERSEELLMEEIRRLRTVVSTLRMEAYDEGFKAAIRVINNQKRIGIIGDE